MLTSIGIRRDAPSANRFVTDHEQLLFAVCRLKLELFQRTASLFKYEFSTAL